MFFEFQRLKSDPINLSLSVENNWQIQLLQLLIESNNCFIIAEAQGKMTQLL